MRPLSICEAPRPCGTGGPSAGSAYYWNSPTMQKNIKEKKLASCDSCNSRHSRFNFCDKLSIMLYLCRTL